MGLKAVIENAALAKSVNSINGRITYETVANVHNILYTPLNDVLQTVVI